MRINLSAVCLFSLLVGCDVQKDEDKLLGDFERMTFTTSSYNYTSYDLYSIRYKDASTQFNVENAPSGGSVFSDIASKAEMDDGREISFESGSCCLIWNKPKNKPLRVRVVWSVVHDREKFDGKLSRDVDERNIRRGGPGNRWCEAFVDIAPPESGVVDPDVITLHFLADGTVEAQLATFGTEKPLPSVYVKAHSQPLPAEQFCKKEIDNPFYGVPRRPHAE